MMGGVNLRPATADDAALVWRWRNDPAAREASRNTAEIAWESHAAWFPQALARSRIFIAEAGGKPVGSARLDPGAGSSTVSLNLAPERRGQGLGRQVLAALCALSDGPLLAEVRRDNTASLKIFQACGFREVGRHGSFVRLRRP